MKYTIKPPVLDNEEMGLFFLNIFFMALLKPLSYVIN